MMAIVGAVTYDSPSVRWFYVANWALGIASPDVLISKRLSEAIDEVWKAGLK